MLKKNKCVLIISDYHAPYNHKDSVSFLQEIKSSYKIDRVINIGDECDFHNISFHDSSPELFSASDELSKAIEHLKPIYKMFPKVDVIESNHGSLIYRKQRHCGLPRNAFRSYQEILEAPKGWNWHNDLTIKLSNGELCYFHHGKTSAPAKLSKNMSMSSAQGHFHSRFEIIYWANPNGLFFDLRVGCLIHDKSLAFSYNKTTLDRPIIGVALIINGHPKLVPMVLDKKGRWIGKLV